MSLHVSNPVKIFPSLSPLRSRSDLSSEINRFEIGLSNKTKKSKESDICKFLKSFAVAAPGRSLLL